MNDTPRTQEAIERWRQGKVNMFDEMAKLEVELKTADEHRRLAEKVAESAMFERDQLRMRLAKVSADVVLEVAQ